HQNDRALQVLDGVLNNPQVPANVVLSIAQAYSQLGQPARMQAALEKLVKLQPDSPEAWYDLAASRAFMRQNPLALDALKKALDLNTRRLAQDPKANDLRSNISADARFAALRDTPEFKALPTH